MINERPSCHIVSDRRIIGKLLISSLHDIFNQESYMVRFGTLIDLIFVYTNPNIDQSCFVRKQINQGVKVLEYARSTATLQIFY